MAASIRQSWVSSQENTNGFGINATGCVAGSRLVLATAFWAQDSDTAVPDGISSVPSLTWGVDATGVYAPVGSPREGQNAAIWSAEVSANGDYQVGVDPSGGTWGHVVLLEVAGLASGAARDRTASAGASNTSDLTPTAGPTAALSQANEFVLAVLGATSGISTADINATLQPGWTRAFYEGDGTTRCAAAVDWRSVASTAAVTASWGTVGSHAQAWASALVTYREAGGIPAGPPVSVAGTLITLGAVSVIPGTVTLGAVNTPPPVDPEPEPPADTGRSQRALHLRGLRGASSAKLLGAAPPNAVPPSTALEPAYGSAIETFYDDFPGSALDRQKWREVFSGSGGGFVFDPSGVSVSNGLLIRTWWDGSVWRTGGIRQGTSAQTYGGFTYGQVSVMARIGAGRGYGPVLALWPTASGGAWTSEIDILQSPAAGKQSGWNRVRGTPPATVQDAAEFSADLTQWHVHTARWEPGRVVFYLDGQELRTVTSITLSQAMAVLLQGYVAAAGDAFYGGAPNDFGEKLIEVAYVRVSQIPGGPQPQPQLPRIVSIQPAGPGALVESVFGQGAVKDFTVTTEGITAIDCVVVQNNASFSWRPGLQTVQTTGTVTVSARFFAVGDFLKVLKNNDYGVYKDSAGVLAFTPGTNPNPNPNPNPAPGTFFEDFNGGNLGQMQHAWGDTGQISVSGGVVHLGGSFNGVGVMSSVPNTSNPNGGFGNGLFEYRAKLNAATTGDNSGPALVLWPANDYWTAVTVRNNGGSFPDHLAREVDVGEVNFGGRTYVAHHYTDCSWGRPECDAYVAYELSASHNQFDWHVYAARLETGRISYYVDGTLIGTDTEHPSPDTKNGGINHIIGFMVGSSDTSLDVDWVKWTPETGTQNPDPDPDPDPPPPTGGDTLNILLRGQSNALLFADYGGFGNMLERIRQQTGRTVRGFASYGDDSVPRTIWSGTAFLGGGSEPGWKATGRQDSIRRFHANLSGAEKAAPFVELWYHNESDQKLWSDYSTQQWVDAVREDASIMRNATGRSAAEHRYFFCKVRYPLYGDPTRIFQGMAQLAADGSFNAVVSDAGLALAMSNGGEHMSQGEAFQLAELLANEISALYP